MRRRLLFSASVGILTVAAFGSLIGTSLETVGVYAAALPGAYLLNFLPRRAIAALPDLFLSLAGFALSASFWAAVTTVAFHMFASRRNSPVA